MDLNNESRTPNDQEANESIREISKFKSNASQCYATLATSFIKLTSGSMNGFAAVLVAELLKEDAEIHMSVDDVSWFSSRYFMLPVGSLLFGIVAHNIGNRPTMLVASALYIVSCLTFYFATDAVMLQIAQAITGLVVPVSSAAGTSYVVEIAQPRLRSALAACTSLSIITAGFFVVLLSNFLHWRILALVILVFPVTGFAAVCTIPESPHWLASKGKLDEAKSALRWVRGWTTCDNVAPEFEKIKETYENNSSKRERTSTQEGTYGYLKNALRPYAHRSFYIPLASMCCIFVLQDCAGFHVLSVFYIVIFREMDSPIEPHVAGSIFDGARIVGALAFMSCVCYTGKKKLTYFSLVVAALSYFTVSAILFLKQYGVYSDVHSWTASIVMILSTFATSVGIDKIVWILNTELFPTKFRNIGSSIGLFVFYITASLSNKLFIYILDVLTMPGVFVVFGVACILNCIIFHVIFPETEGRTLKEIEDHYDGVKKLRN